MLQQTTPYLSLTHHGESRWWSWFAGFWGLVIGWIIGQTILTGPIPDIADTIDPERVTQLEAAFLEYFTDEIAMQFGLLLSFFLVTSVIAAILFLIACLTSGTLQKIMAFLSGLFMAGSLLSLFMLIPLTSTPEINTAFTGLIGLSPINYALMLLTFPVAAGVLFLIQKFWHKRSILSLLTARREFDYKRVLFSMGLVWVVFAVIAFIMHVSGTSTLRFVFDPSRFFMFAIVTILFIPLQSATEEIVFRGYFNQGFAHFIPNVWIVFIITSVLFASLHLANPEAAAGAEGGRLIHLLTMSQYFLFGFAMSVIVYFEDGLEAAIGVHAGNNMFAAMIMNYEGSVLPTPSVFLAKPNTIIDTPMVLITLGLVVFILYKTRRKDTV